MIVLQVLRAGVEMLLLSALLACGLRQLPLFKSFSILRVTAGIAVGLDLIATGGTTVLALAVLALAGVLSRQAWRQRQRIAVLGALLTRLRGRRSARQRPTSTGNRPPLTQRFRATPRAFRRTIRTRQTGRAA